MPTPPSDAAPCPEIGKGWFLQTVPRKHGKHIDRYWYSPCGRKFRSRPEVDRFIQSTGSKEKLTLKHALGKVIYKKFPSGSSDELVEFKGTIENYDPDRKLYKIVYDDGDEEEMSEEDIDLVMKRKKNELRNERRKAARSAAVAKARSPSSGNNKRKSTNNVDNENPYKKQYKSNKSSSAEATESQVSKSQRKSKSKKIDELMPPISNIPPEEMRAAILENRLPQGFIQPPSAPTARSNRRKITLKAAARSRVEAAKRWVASAALNVEHAKQQLESARKARLDALNEQVAATHFLEQVMRSTGESNTASLLVSKQTIIGAGSVLPTKKTYTVIKIPVSNIERTDLVDHSKTNSASKPADEMTAATNEEANDTKANNEHIVSNERKDHCEASGKSDENKSSVDKELVNNNESKEREEQLLVHKQQTNNLPLKKRPSSIASTDGRDDSCEAGDDADNSIIYLKTSARPVVNGNRRFSDLRPEAQEVLRKTVLAALSNNGEIDPESMKRATSIGIPSHAVEDAVKVAWEKLRSKASDAAKSNTSSGRVLHSIELSGFALSEFDGVYERCREESKPGHDQPPSFQKKLVYNGKTAIFSLRYCGDDYQKDPSKWEVSLLHDEADKGETRDKVAAATPRYYGSITREKASDSNSMKSFTRTWITPAGKECEVTVSPLYSRVI